MRGCRRQGVSLGSAGCAGNCAGTPLVKVVIRLFVAGLHSARAANLLFYKGIIPMVRNGVQVVGGSNPLTPTKQIKGLASNDLSLFFRWCYDGAMSVRFWFGKPTSTTPILLRSILVWLVVRVLDPLPIPCFSGA